MVCEIIFRPAVKAEIEEAAKWYEDHRKELAQSSLEDLQAVLKAITSNPAIFQYVYSDVRKGSMKKFPYNIFYRHTDDKIIIYMVLHQKRNPKVWKKAVRKRDY